MRRILLLCALAALAVPVLASAMPRSAGDGTLSIRDGKVKLLVLHARGGVIGRCGRCRITLDDLTATDRATPFVTGEDNSRDTDQDGEDEQFWGTNVRFRLTGGEFTLRVTGRDVDLSAVGRGRGKLRGAGGPNDGTYSLNGEEARSLPDERTPFRLIAPTSQ